MGQLICFFGVGVLITLLHIFKLFLMEEDYKFFEILGYYLKATLILNIVLILLVLIIKQYFIWNEELTNGFIINYIVCGSILSLFLPAVYYKVRNIGKKKKDSK